MQYNLLCSTTLKKCILWKRKSQVKLSIVNTAVSYTASYQKYKLTVINIFICTGSLRILCIYFHHINSSFANSSKIYILLFFLSYFCVLSHTHQAIHVTEYSRMCDLPFGYGRITGTKLREKLTLLIQQLTICNSSLARG